MVIGWVLGVSVVSVSIVGFSIFSLIAQRFHMIGVLLSLEMMLLGLFLFFGSVVWGYGEIYLSLVILTLGVMEGSLGLSLLVSLVRVYGSDYLTSLFLCKL